MEKITAILKQRHLKPADLARMTSFSPSRLSKWFNGAGVPSVYQAFTIARELGVPLEWLADDNAPARPPKGLDEDDRTILRMARTLGAEEAIRRLMAPKEIPKFEGTDGNKNGNGQNNHGKKRKAGG